MDLSLCAGFHTDGNKSIFIAVGIFYRRSREQGILLLLRKESVLLRQIQKIDLRAGTHVANDLGSGQRTERISASTKRQAGCGGGRRDACASGATMTAGERRLAKSLISH